MRFDVGVEPVAPGRHTSGASGGNTGNPLYTSLLGDQWEFKTPESNYTVFRCDPAARAMTVSVVNGDGRELFSRRYA